MTASPKPIIRSMTVWSSILTALSYAGVEISDLQTIQKVDFQKIILIVGVALISIFLRRAIPGEKSLWRSRTVWSALFMVIGYLVSRQMEQPPGVTGGIVMLGMLGIVFFMRSALANLYGDPE